MMYCTQCGARNREEEEVCWQCHTRLMRRRQTVPGQSRKTDPEMQSSWSTPPDRDRPSLDQAPTSPSTSTWTSPPHIEKYEPYQSQLQGPHQPQSLQSPASSQSILAMVLSILGVVGCGPLSAIPGLFLGWREMKAIKEGRSSPAGVGFAKVGFYLGLIVTVLSLLGGLFWFFSFLAWLL
jgi:hypothetical protein